MLDILSERTTWGVLFCLLPQNLRHKIMLFFWCAYTIIINYTWSSDKNTGEKKNPEQGYNKNQQVTWHYHLIVLGPQKLMNMKSSTKVDSRPSMGRHVTQLLFPQSPKIGGKKKNRGEKLQPFLIIWLSSQRATGKAVIKRLAWKNKKTFCRVSGTHCWTTALLRQKLFQERRNLTIKAWWIPAVLYFTDSITIDHSCDGALTFGPETSF